MKALLLPVGTGLYAVPFTDVLEVIGSPAVTPVPGCPASVRGLFNLRGQVLPLVDTALLLGLPGGGDCQSVAVVAARSGAVGLVATGKAWGGILDGDVTPAEAGGAVGIYDVGGRAATLLDVDALLAGLQAEPAVG